MTEVSFRAKRRNLFPALAFLFTAVRAAVLLRTAGAAAGVLAQRSAQGKDDQRRHHRENDYAYGIHKKIK